MNDKNEISFEDLPIKTQFEQIFERYKRQIETNVLFNVLTKFYFADWTRRCDYEKMTSEEIVNVVMEVCKDLEKEYDYDIDDDLFPHGF